MNIDFIEVLLTVLSLVLLAVPGFILAKCKMIPEKGAEALSNVVLYACQPMMVFMGFQGKQYNSDVAINMLYVAGASFAVHFIMIAVVSCIKEGDNEAKMRCVRYGSVFGNCGFMGIPFLKMLFTGETQGEILIYTAVVLSVWNVLNWTFGVYMMTKDKKTVSVKKILLNPVIIAVVLGFLSFVILKQPIADVANGTEWDSVLEKIMSVFNMIGDAVTPMSMTVVGIKLANVNLKQLFLDKLAYLQSGLKLILMSFVSILVVAFLPIDVTVKYAVFFTMSMPAATSVALFAVKFNADADFGSVCVLLSTTLSVVTIPLMFLVLKAFGVVV